MASRIKHEKKSLEQNSILRESVYTTQSVQNKEIKLLDRITKIHGPHASIVKSQNYWHDEKIKKQIMARDFIIPNGVIKLSEIQLTIVST